MQKAHVWQWVLYMATMTNTYPPALPLLEGQSRFLVQILPLSRFFITVSCFFTACLGTNLSLDLMIFSFFCQARKNAPLLDRNYTFSGILSCFCFRQVGRYWRSLAMVNDLKHTKAVFHRFQQICWLRSCSLCLLHTHTWDKKAGQERISTKNWVSL